MGGQERNLGHFSRICALIMDIVFYDRSSIIKIIVTVNLWWFNLKNWKINKTSKQNKEKFIYHLTNPQLIQWQKQKNFFQHQAYGKDVYFQNYYSKFK